jgi:hypothetical protein
LNYSLGQRISTGESGFFFRRIFFPDIVGGATLKPDRETILSWSFGKISLKSFRLPRRIAQDNFAHLAPGICPARNP